MLELLNSCAMAFDIPVLNWIHAHLVTSDLAYNFWHFITLFGEAGIFWILLAVGLAIYPKTRKVGLTMGLALAMGLLICNITIKPLVARPRPVDFLASMGVTLPFKVIPMDDFSFPSGHTIASFEASVALLLYSRKWGIPALILGIMVSFSRLCLYVHYPTDVLVSVVLGTVFAVIAYFALRNVKIPEHRQHGKYERNKKAA